MIISLDESGSFVHASHAGSWSVVAAFAFTERKKSKAYAALVQAKKSCKREAGREIKLKDLSEQQYFNFLRALQNVDGTLFSVATDTGIGPLSSVIKHQQIQAHKIRVNVDRMRYEEGKKAVSKLADEIDALSPQLYVQLQCQAFLIRDILNRAILFFVQRDPKTLRRFVWNIDQKNTNKNRYEEAFETVTPALLQSSSFREPMIHLQGADYSYFEPFKFSKEQYPKYLEEEYEQEPKSTVNVGKIIRDNMSFPNSKFDKTVQIADLLASGIRRCLRGGFIDNKKASILLGKLMVQPLLAKQYAIKLVSISDVEALADNDAGRALILMTQASQRMIVDNDL